MTRKEKLHLLLSAMTEYMAKQITTLPETGNFEPCSVSMNYPGTKYTGILRCEPVKTDPSGRGRWLRTFLVPEGSDRAVSHFLFQGTNGECLAWLQDRKSETVLREDYASLKQSADRAD